MATRYVTPYVQYFYGIDRGPQLAGIPIAGGILFFFASNSSVLQNIYSDAQSTTPRENPITLDEAGSPGNVFLLDDTAYRVKLIDPAGNTIFDMDPVVSFAPSIA